MQPIIAIASSRRFAGDDADEPLVRASLAAAGFESEVVLWDDPAVDWERFALVLIRSTWDSTDHPDAYLAWARRVDAATVLRNPLAIIEWNIDKHYLADLASAGIPVVPTAYIEPGATWFVPDREFVVKPTISGGGVDTARYSPDEETAAHVHVRRLHGAGHTAMVQEYEPSVDSHGELALIYFGDSFSHAVRKGPLLRPGEGVVERLWEREVITEADPSPHQHEVAAATIRAVRDRLGTDPLYARIDIVDGRDGRELVLEAELIDPSLFLPHAAGSADRLAEQVIRALSV